MENNDENIIKITKKPWQLRNYTQDKIFRLMKMYASGGVIKYGSISFKEIDIPTMAEILFTLKPFRKEFNKIKRKK